MAYSDNFPAVRPVFQADFANGGRIDPRISYSRSTTGTYFGTAKHESSQNLVLQSQDLDTSPWVLMSGINGSLTGSQTAPDGTSTAWLATAGTAASTIPAISQDISAIASGEQMTASAYVKAGTATHAYVIFRSQYDSYAWAQLEFASPSSVTTGGNAFSGITGNVVALANGWYRISVSATTDAGTSATVRVGMSDGSGWSNSGYVTYTPTGETFYAWGIQLEKQPSSTAYNATTTQIHREYAPTLQTAASGAARFEYSTDGQSIAKGILIESQSTNLLINSADFGGSWQIINATKSLEAIGPDGTLSAIAFREGTNSLEKRLLRYYGAGGGNVTISVYAKLMGNTRRLVIREANASGQQSVFDIATGTKVTGNGSIDSVGNGWYRCQLNFSSSNTTQAAGFYLIPADGGGYVDSTYAGDGYSGLLLAMPQAEDQSFASSYISTGTSGSTVTRAAESLTVAMADVGVSQGPVSAVVEGAAGSGSTPHLISLSDGTTANRWSIYRDSLTADTSTDYRLFVRTDSSSVVSKIASSSASATKFAMRIDTDNFAVCAGGGTVETDTAGVAPVTTTIHIADDYNGGNQANGHIKRVALYGDLSDTNLQALTS